VERKDGVHAAVEAVGAKHSGAARVLEQTLRACLEHGQFSRVSVFTSPLSTLRASLPTDRRLDVIECADADRTRLGRMLWYEAGLARSVERCGADVLLHINALGVPSPRVPSVAMVQQSLPFSPEALALCGVQTKLRMSALRGSMGRCVAQAERTIVQTPTMLRWIRDAFGLAEGRLHVITPEAPELPAPAPSAAGAAHGMARATPGDRLLYVGNASAYKNLGVLAQAAELLRRERPAATVFTTLPQGHPRCQAEGLVSLGPLDRAALASAYAAADLLVMPSLVETVGLPLLEAMSAGLPVLAADRPYAHDVCGRAAVYFDPLDPRHLTREALALLASPLRRHELVRLGAERAAELAARVPGRQLAELLQGTARRTH
jgi:glycosyltransferase involved in cell wall biosynthesis